MLVLNWNFCFAWSGCNRLLVKHLAIYEGVRIFLFTFTESTEAGDVGRRRGEGG